MGFIRESFDTDINGTTIPIKLIRTDTGGTNPPTLFSAGWGCGEWQEYKSYMTEFAHKSGSEVYMLVYDTPKPEVNLYFDLFYLEHHELPTAQLWKQLLVRATLREYFVEKERHVSLMGYSEGAMHILLALQGVGGYGVEYIHNLYLINPGSIVPKESSFKIALRGVRNAFQEFYVRLTGNREIQESLARHRSSVRTYLQRRIGDPFEGMAPGRIDLWNPAWSSLATTASSIAFGKRGETRIVGSTRDAMIPMSALNERFGGKDTPHILLQELDATHSAIFTHEDQVINLLLR